MAGITEAEPALDLVAHSDVDVDHDHNHDHKHNRDHDHDHDHDHSHSHNHTPNHTPKPHPNPLSHLSSSPSTSLNPNPSAIATIIATTNVPFLADQFAKLIPSDTVSVAALQGYLLRHKLRPEVAVLEASKWVEGGFQQGPKTAEAVKRLED
jgi:hypothetical protein